MAGRNFKAIGLVLRSRILGESDRLITVLTPDRGKFEAVARGARKTKSKLAAGVDLFTHGSFDFYSGKTWPVLTGQDVIEHFSCFREDYTCYPYGLYLAELVDRLVSGEESNPEIFNLLLDGWKLLGENLDRALLCRAFELKLAHAAGYSPHLDACTGCGMTGNGAFSPRQGGLVCSECRGIDLIRLDPGTLALAKHLLQMPLASSRKVRSTNAQKDQLRRVNTAFLAYHPELGDIKTRKLLDE